MSIDLDIVTSQRLELSHLNDFFYKRRPYHFEGGLTDQGTVEVWRQTRSGDNITAFTMDGPLQVELEDLEDEIIAAVLAPRWRVEISVPSGSSAADLKIAKDLARHIAQTCQGAVYDLEEGKVIWPKRSLRRFVTRREEQRIRLVTLEWFLPSDNASSETAGAFLHLLRKICPDAYPVRMGTFEPLQHRIEFGNTELFLKMWNEARSVEYGDSFFWKARHPCYGGGVRFPDWRDIFKPDDAERAINIDLSFDGRALHGDVRWSETVVALFTQIARRLKSFYALGYVQREVVVRRNIGFDSRTEPSPTLPGKWWLGLPEEPTWLVWFGAEYAREIEKHLDPIIIQKYPEGLFLKLGPEPMDKGQLSGVFPLLPSRLIAQKIGDKYHPAKRIPSLK